MPILESSIERHITRLAVSEGMITFKVSPASSRGWPDRVFINKHGLHLYIEFKAPGEKIRRLQEHRIKTMRDSGCWVEVIDNIGEGYNVIFEFREARVVPS